MLTLRESVATLLVNMLAKEESLPLEITHRTKIWSIVELIMRPGNGIDSSTDPSADAEEEVPISLENDARTEGIEAAVRYGIWVRSRVSDLPAGRAGLPEVFDLLDRAVDPGAQTTRGVREALGHWLPQISFLDEEWLGVKEAQLFPREEQLYSIYRFSWQSFIVTTHAFTAVFRRLGASYLRATTLIVIDGIGGEILSDALKALALEGSLTTLGYSASRKATIDVTDIIVPQASIRSLNMFRQPQATVTDAWKAIVSLLQSGGIKPIVAKTFPLVEAAEALRYLVEGRPFGRVVLTI